MEKSLTWGDNSEQSLIFLATASKISHSRKKLLKQKLYSHKKRTILFLGLYSLGARGEEIGRLEK